MNFRNFLIKTTMLCLFVSLTAGIGAAGDKATKDDVITKIDEAVKMVQSQGVEATLKAVNDPDGPFVFKDTYIFALTANKTVVAAHPIKPKLVGKSLMHVKDANGKLFFAEFSRVGKSAEGKGWVDYMWPKPGEKKPSPKESYIFKVPGEDVLLAAGIYK